MPGKAREPASDWQSVTVPGSWKETTGITEEGKRRFAWYRCYVRVPDRWTGDRETLWTRSVTLFLDHVSDAYEVYINGTRIGRHGAFPPDYRKAPASSQHFSVPIGLLKKDRYNAVSIRSYNRKGRGGFLGRAPILTGYYKELVLKGTWAFKWGDSSNRTGEPIQDRPKIGVFEEAREAVSPLSRPSEFIHGHHLPPETSAEKLQVANDFEVDLVLSEPTIAQPLSIKFDAQGRLWVVEYRQYPFPAGLTMQSRDKYYRAVYDQMPPPPPHPKDSKFRGRDRITIHEDSDGDGRFDRHKTFVDGLNIATACLPGPNGVWVLSPPYLLFYPDQDRNDVPDRKPVVHLKGFGLEDTHSVVNSLSWGPDGWLYGAQGSTVSANVTIPGKSSKPVHSMGQAIWRYHPKTRQYELFAEGGGNAFGLEIDSKGRLFSGNNGGNSRGFHYVQGAYFEKGIAKHGPLSNPYAFGQIPPMPHHQAERFSHSFVIYEGDSFPERYHRKLFGVEPLHGRIVLSDLTPLGSTFKTKDLSRPLESQDPSFRPVNITLGPDGALYIADFYEEYIAHGQNYQGYLDPTSGRIYRLQAKAASPVEPFNLYEKTNRGLVALLKHDNRWFRKMARRLLSSREPEAIVPDLKQRLNESSGRLALESLWLLNRLGAFNASLAAQTLEHRNPYVRSWTVRLLGDDHEVSDAMAERLRQAAATESSPEVRRQYACTAKRLPAGQALPIVKELVEHEQDVDDPQIPLLLWWAIESKCAANLSSVLQLFEEDHDIWQSALVRQELLGRLMRRLAAAGGRSNFLGCARLLRSAPGKQAETVLINAFEKAFQGRASGELPPPLVKALTEAGGHSLSLRMRQGDSEAIRKALTLIQDNSVDVAERVDYIEAFGDIRHSESVPVLLDLIDPSHPSAIVRAALGALQQYNSPAISKKVIRLFSEWEATIRNDALTLLSTRKAWTRNLLKAIQSGKIAKEAVPPEIRQQLRWQEAPKIAALFDRVLGHKADAAGQKSKAVRSLLQTVSSGEGNPYEGRKIFQSRCASCHRLFGQGGDLGPPLTSYNRDDLNRLLFNIARPNAEIREGYGTYIARTKDGRQLAGFLVDRSPNVVTLRALNGESVTIEKNNLEKLERSPRSLMPDNLLSQLSDEAIRDLVAYLRSGQPLN